MRKTFKRNYTLNTFSESNIEGVSTLTSTPNISINASVQPRDRDVVLGRGESRITQELVVYCDEDIRSYDRVSFDYDGETYILLEENNREINNLNNSVKHFRYRFRKAEEVA